MFMDLVLEGLLREHLMVAPLLVVVGITEQLVTMGAEDFKVRSARIKKNTPPPFPSRVGRRRSPPRPAGTLGASPCPFPLFGSPALLICRTRSMFVAQDFVVSFFVELSVMMLERLYLDPGAKEVGGVDSSGRLFKFWVSSCFRAICGDVIRLSHSKPSLARALPSMTHWCRHRRLQQWCATPSRMS